MNERRRPVGADDLISAAVDLGVLVPVRRRRPRPARQVMRELVLGIMALAALGGIGLAILEFQS